MAAANIDIYAAKKRHYENQRNWPRALVDLKMKALASLKSQISRMEIWESLKGVNQKSDNIKLLVFIHSAWKIIAWNALPKAPNN